MRPLAAALLVVASAAACAPAARYTAPATPAAPAFKENADWKTAAPSDQVVRGHWWEAFTDPQLNALEAQIDVSNEGLKAAEARFAQARAAVRGARAGLYPQATVNPAIAAAEQSGNRAASSFHSAYGDFVLPVDVTYEADVWGRVRGTVAARRSEAQATAADLESVGLSVHAELAIDYFVLRGSDRESELLQSAVTAFEQALELTQNRFRGGLASEADVAQAQTQLETTRAQRVDLEGERAALEHAIAVLVGQPPSTFTLAPARSAMTPPSVPAGLPADLLERRPDIAAAERRAAEANAQIGVANAAFYPILALTGAAGFESSSIASWISSASTFWSLVPGAVVTAFDAGRRRAVSDQARAAYEQTAANYRDTVLTALREVEDELATLRVLDEEAAIQARAVEAAERSLTLATNRYRGGIVSYLEVIVAQNAALANQRASVNILTRRMAASVLLIKALGGGWSRSDLPVISPD
jgi:NodT family efflux transporter outer membrane factor (OMF) lipoprotein